MQDAADQLGIADQRAARGDAGASSAGGSSTDGSTGGSSTGGSSTGGSAVGVPVAGGSAGPGGSSGSARPARDADAPRDGTGGGVTSGRGSHVGGSAWPGTAAASAAGASGTPAAGVAGVSGTPAAGVAGAAESAPAGARPGAGEYEPTASDGVPAAPVGATPWAGTDTNAGPDDGSVPLPATVFAPPLVGADDEDDEPPSAGADAPTALMAGGSRLPRTAVAPALDPEQQDAGAGAGAGASASAGGGAGAGVGATPPAGMPGPRSAGDLADAATSRATVPPRGARGTGPATPPPPGRPPGAPGGRPGVTPPESGPGTSGGPAGGYVPTQLVSRPGPGEPQPPGAPQPPGPPGVPGTPPGGVHHAATVLANPSPLAGPGAGPAGPGAPQPPGPPGAPGTPPGGVHHAATMLANPSPVGPGAPQPPGPPGPVPHAPPSGPQNAYGYPQQQQHQQQPAAVPTVGPGYQAVLRYRAPDGTEQQLIRRSAPGTPHPEWQIFHELRAMNVPSDQVLELHTELESCELPGGYCARMIRETWPQARITSIAPYGRDHAGRQDGMRQLLTHQGELHQVADGPARPAPVRAPLPQVQPAPPVPPEGVAHELVGSFGPQGICRFDQRAVSRQGVPEIVARTLVWAGLPADFGPFFWAQPANPVVPTLAELAAQRQVQPASDANAYLVVGSDFGRAICVQYGTAHIVAVPVEGGPGGQSIAPQFVNSGLPEFTRSLALLGRMWRLRFGLNPEQAGRWTVDFQAQLATLDPAALSSPDSWWSVLLEQMWDGLI
ncbi:SUKH-4 family immunity protein [Streptomyces tirandamycinicus]|uniref:SUKH-4 family immunity protein n=1 Tax=Streptomyces tirandamycinicus TaxID=2174846 RepID=UPI003F4D7432